MTMYYIQEMSVKEISAILNVSENTVKSRLNYARKNIEEKVKELEKKGTKLYSLAPIPFFVLLLHTEADACEAEAVAGMYGSSASSAGASATGSTTSSTGTAMSGSGVLATGGTGTESSAGTTAATAGGLSLGAKIAIGIISALFVIGGAIGVGVAVYNHMEDSETAQEDQAESEEGQEQQEQSDLPYQGEYKKYLSSQNILYGQSVDRVLTTDGENLNYKIEFPEGTIGYLVQDVNHDGKEELIQLELNTDGIVTISEKMNQNGQIIDTGGKKTIDILWIFDKVGFYTFNSGEDTYLLVTYGYIEGLFANGETVGLYCYKFENGDMIPVIEKTESFSTGEIGEEEFDYIPYEYDITHMWMDNINKVMSLQGKSINRSQCADILYDGDFNLEPYMELSRFVSLKMNKTYQELSDTVEKVLTEWEYNYPQGMANSETIEEKDIIHKAVLSSQLITP